MTTFVSASQNWSNNTTFDSTFQEMCQWIHEAITGCGIVDTNDTGAANLATITRGGVANSIRGYRMYRFDDSRQGVDPIFLKIGYATGTNYQNPPSLYMQVGQGTDGSLGLTGQTSSNLRTGGENTYFVKNPFSAQNYSCHTEGFFGGHFGRHMDAQVSSQGFNYHNFAIARSRDSNYNFDGAGVFLLLSNTVTFTTPNSQFVRFASPAATGSAGSQFCICPGLPSSSALLNGEKQLYPHFYYDVGVGIYQAWATFTVRGDEFGINPTTFSATPIAAGGARTYCSFGSTASMYGDSSGNSSFRTCLLWE